MFIIFLISGCSDKNEKQATEQTKEAVTQAQQQAAQPMPPNQGVVVSFTQTGTYTYVEVDNNGNRFWLAGNAVQIKIGDVIHWGKFSVMQNFHSKSLNKTFPQVLFVDAINPGAAPPPTPPQKAVVRSVIVVEGYNYLELEPGNGIWLAAPISSVNKGDTITWGKGSVMRNFFSKSLNRTFEEITFVSAVTVLN